jgi:excisionase family DNA binding protein
MTIIKLLTISEVCKILRVSKPTAYNLIHSKGFPRIKVGREWRVEEQLLLKWIQENSSVS